MNKEDIDKLSIVRETVATLVRESLLSGLKEGDLTKELRIAFICGRQEATETIKRLEVEHP